jgi:GDPmannose 4,6-dehydratase
VNPAGQRKAVITGICGQDGAYLAQFLLAKGYEVSGTSRNAETVDRSNLSRLGIQGNIQIHSLDLLDGDAVGQHLQASAYDEVYHLAGESSVGQSYSQPRAVIQGAQTATLNILESGRRLMPATRYFFAGSSECFGDTHGEPADELTPFRPQSPYAIAKAAAYWQVALYREAYRLHCCTGILFNHESPLRPDQFVIGKIVSSARRIAAGSDELLELGDISVQRDWGWAAEYVEAMWIMLQQMAPEDYVIATGKTCALRDMVAEAFSNLGLNWRDHVAYKESLRRPLDAPVVRGNPEKAKHVLSWQARTSGVKVARRMVVEQTSLMAKEAS